ncbi:TonB-dependent receptor family protein [Algoriphagus sediminis]|uniref:TonB-dependent receptor n=1 Tax=Algoriphagus sediminis TaxID=3057113 RepID=A0ABT7YCJ9_9BACT|nr:TonB-dependent receptor [Algoriphagus sediminis]MDN3204250.1 TonB-dependent receptor [Algoriphagus sediminis]
MRRIFTLLLLFISLVCYGQITIKVLDQESQIPIQDVIFESVDGKTELSDESGQVTFNSLKSETFIVSKEGYQTLRVRLSPGENVVFLKKLAIDLSQVTVTAFESQRPLLEQSAAIAVVREADFNRFNETSLVNSFNTKPGVRIEERAPASYRVSIRGSSLRAPFGVRNVKVYWNEVPFTAPDGTTPLNLLDLTNIRTGEVIKGPSGSVYGAGNGGVINLSSPAQVSGNRVSSDLLLGDFGLVKYRLGLAQKIGSGALEASFVSQKSDGYRDHSAMDRKVFQLSGSFNPSEKQEIRTQLLVSDLQYEIPGGLNEDQLNEDPTQARPGSENQNSSIDQQTIFGSLAQSYTFSTNTKNTTALYLMTTEFENPFILDYKKELSFGYGGRTSFELNGNLLKKPMRIVLGAEAQGSVTDAQNFGNVNGVADTIRFADKLRASQAFLFQQLEWNLSEKFLFTLGLSENFSSFEIDRQVDASGGATGIQKRTFDPILIPRVALNYRISEFTAMYGSISSGFSPPTIDEVRTNEGSLNLDLEAERGQNYEIGFRHGKEKLNIDFTAYFFKLDETITTFTNEQGVVLFQNAGATDQKGIEAAIDYDFIRNGSAAIRNLSLGTAYTGQFFTFVDYQKRENDFSGNDLTGVPQTTLVSRFDLRTSPGIYLNLTHQYVSEIPLNDANSVYQDPFNLMNLRIGWAGNLGRKWDLEIFTGIDNLLDEVYSLGNDLNPFGGRFYQPSPARNWYGGIKLGFNY